LRSRRFHGLRQPLGVLLDERAGRLHDALAGAEVFLQRDLLDLSISVAKVRMFYASLPRHW